MQLQMHPFCYNQFDRRINICAVTVENNVQLHQLNTDIILILDFAIDYLHFVL